MIKFTKERVLLIYQMIVNETGGEFGIRSDDLLESAIEAPFQTFNGKELFPTKIEKAARLGYGLVANHPFLDGNKRIGVHIMISFLETNGIHLAFSDEIITDIALGIASGKYKYEDVLKILNELKWN